MAVFDGVEHWGALTIPILLLHRHGAGLPADGLPAAIKLLKHFKLLKFLKKTFVSIRVHSWFCNAISSFPGRIFLWKWEKVKKTSKKF